MFKPKIAATLVYRKYNHHFLTSTKRLSSSDVKPTLSCLLSAPRHSASTSRSHPQFSTTMRTSTVEYNWIDGVERLAKYEPGGYHPVMIDDLLHNRYRIVDKLGYGGYSTIWLARDEAAERYVAVKVGVSNPLVDLREIEILKALSSTFASLQDDDGPNIKAYASLPVVLDAFDVRGPNGTHKCYTLIPAQGDLKEASFSRLFPIKVARALAANLVNAVAFVHSRGFVHGDIHLRNILIKLPSTFDELSVEDFREKFGKPETVPITRVDGKPLTTNAPTEAVLPLYLGKNARDFTLDDAHRLLLSDFGETFPPATEQRLGKDCHIPVTKRAPEAFFEPDKPLSYSSDIWSLGTAIWEILGMKAIFSDSEPPDEIIAEQIDVLGYQGFPESWRKDWERKGEDEVRATIPIPRQPLGSRETWPDLENAFENFVQKYRREREDAGAFEKEETEAILELMRGMLQFRPEQRLTIKEVLASEWMVKWALPQLEST